MSVPDFVTELRKKSLDRANEIWKWWYEGAVADDLAVTMRETPLSAKEWAHAAEQWIVEFRKRTPRGFLRGFDRARVFSGFGAMLDQILLRERDMHGFKKGESKAFMLQLFCGLPMVVPRGGPMVNIHDLAVGIGIYTGGKISSGEIMVDLATAVAFSLPQFPDMLPTFNVSRRDGIWCVSSNWEDPLKEARKREGEARARRQSGIRVIPIEGPDDE